MKLCIVAGEASGDLHAAHLVAELRRLDPGLECFGIGGSNLLAQDVRLLEDVRRMAIVGLFNVISQIPFFFRTLRMLKQAIQEGRPDAVVLVDFPDFNLMVAKFCKRRGIPVIYYISPQVWAWRKKRIRTIAKRVDLMIVIFPFEEDLYRKAGVPVAYVGHPLIEQLEPHIRNRTERGPLRIALMPGSRGAEVRSVLPAMLNAVERLRGDLDFEAFLIKAPTIRVEDLDVDELARRDISLVETGHTAALSRATIVFCSSGTATLEAAILGVPAVVVYRLSSLTHLVVRRLVRLPNFSLVNIVAGKTVVPELLQDEVSGETIAACAREMLETARYGELERELAAVRKRLGSPGASRRAAEKIVTLLGLSPPGSTPRSD